MNKLFVISISVLLLFSCSDNQSINNSNVVLNQKPTVKKDTIKHKEDEVIVKKNLIQNNIFNKIDSVFSIPLSVDSTFITNIIDLNNQVDTSTLSANEVRFLTEHLFDSTPDTYLISYLKDFYNLDSLIQNNTYNKYVDELDIGMMKFCRAYINGQIELSNDTTIVLWSLTYSTFEACPFTFGTKILATLFINDNKKNCIQIGELSGGGDAPMYWETNMFSKIESQQIHTDFESFAAEMTETNDDIYLEQNDTAYQIKITNNGFQF